MIRSSTAAEWVASGPAGLEEWVGDKVRRRLGLARFSHLLGALSRIRFARDRRESSSPPACLQCVPGITPRCGGTPPGRQSPHDAP